VAAASELALSWYLPGAGQDLFGPVWVISLVGGVIVVLGLCSIGLASKTGVAGPLPARWGLWIGGGAALIVVSYLSAPVGIAYVAVGLVTYLLWRMYPSLPGRHSRSCREMPKLLRVLGVGSVVSLLWRPYPSVRGEDFQLSGHIPRAFRVLALGSSVVVLIAAVAAVEWVLPLRVESHETTLDRLAACAVRMRPSCPRATQWDVPGLGEMPRSEITVLNGNEVQFGRASGYLSAPGRSLSAVGVADLDCVRHLYGQWWEFDTSFSTVPGTCPWGLSFVVGP